MMRVAWALVLASFLTQGCVSLPTRQGTQSNTGDASSDTLAGLAVAQLKTELSAVVSATADIRTQMTGVSYNSQFGLLTALCILTAMLVVMITSHMRDRYSHERAMARIRRNQEEQE